MRPLTAFSSPTANHYFLYKFTPLKPPLKIPEMGQKQRRIDKEKDQISIFLNFYLFLFW